MPAAKGLLTLIKEIVQKQKGIYGAQRVERAADEVPNLENQYSQRALENAFTGDNAQSLMVINPADFQKYSSQLPKENLMRYRDLTINTDGSQMSFDDYIKHLQGVSNNGGFSDVPFLRYDISPQGLPFITGHEGRHRSRALADMGNETSLVRGVPHWDLREEMPRNTQKEYIDALREKLIRGYPVYPEENPVDGIFRRPRQPMPEQFRKGGLAQCSCQHDA